MSRLKTGILLLLSTFIASCNNSTSTQTAGNTRTDTAANTTTTTTDTTAADAGDSEYETMYAVIADTGTNYYMLDSKMYAISRKMNLPIDTMDRHFDAAKNSIVLPDTIDDEMYRGEYYPRRDFSRYLSLDYYVVYSRNTTQNNIALIAGLYETQKSADSLCTLLKQAENKAFVVKASVFAGCMH